MIVSETPSLSLDPNGDKLSPIRGTRAPRSQATRRRLLDAGRGLFAEFGPHAVTSHAIAEQAGYASGTFYLHFKDKLALFRELAEEAALELETRLQTVVEDKTDPVEIVQAQAEALVGFAEDQPVKSVHGSWIDWLEALVTAVVRPWPPDALWIVSTQMYSPRPSSACGHTCWPGGPKIPLALRETRSSGPSPIFSCTEIAPEREPLVDFPRQILLLRRPKETMLDERTPDYL